MTRRLLACGLLLLAAACAGENSTPTSDPSLSAGSVGGKRYIVVFKDNVVGAQAATDQLVATAGTKPDYVYSASIKGFAARMSDQAADQIRRDSRVAYIELDGPVHITTTQSPTPSWGLDRIDQHTLPLNNSYTYNRTGAGVHLYDIDTGLHATHVDFTGRVGNGHTEVLDGRGTDDCHGHGTHTAGTVGGTTYGVAKAVKIHAVRVLDCGGSGTFAQVIAGIDWVTANHISPAVANMSLGGSKDSATNAAVTASIASGVTYGISAGNNFGNACNNSPASTPNAITVAASDITDHKASFSDTGPCVDIFGPGVNIVSDWNTSNTATATLSGTSMSAPHVTGVAALYLEANPTATPAQVAAALVNNATNGAIIAPIGLTGTPNKLIYMGFIGGGGGNQPPVANFTATCNASHSCTFTSTSTDDGTIVSYNWVRGDLTVSTASSWSRTFASARTLQITLTVTDNGGLSGSVTKTVVVP
jgi:subtilisin family serine protease